MVSYKRSHNHACGSIVVKTGPELLLPELPLGQLLVFTIRHGEYPGLEHMARELSTRRAAEALHGTLIRKRIEPVVQRA